MDRNQGAINFEIRSAHSVREKSLRRASLRCAGGFDEILHLRSDSHAIDQHRGHRPFGLDAEAADPVTQGQRVAPSRRQAFHGFIMSGQGAGQLFRDAVQITKAHADLVAELSGQPRDLEPVAVL